MMTERNYNKLSINPENVYASGSIPNTLREGMEIVKDITKTMLRNKVLLITMTCSALGSGCGSARDTAIFMTDAGRDMTTIGSMTDNEQLKKQGRELSKAGRNLRTIDNIFHRWTSSTTRIDNQLASIPKNIKIPNLSIKTKDRGDKAIVKEYNDAVKLVKSSYNKYAVQIKRILTAEKNKIKSQNSSKDRKQDQIISSNMAMLPLSSQLLASSKRAYEAANARVQTILPKYLKTEIDIIKNEQRKALTINEINKINILNSIIKTK